MCRIRIKEEKVATAVRMALYKDFFCNNIMLLNTNF